MSHCTDCYSEFYKHVLFSYSEFYKHVLYTPETHHTLLWILQACILQSSFCYVKNIHVLRMPKPFLGVQACENGKYVCILHSNACWREHGCFLRCCSSMTFFWKPVSNMSVLSRLCWNAENVLVGSMFFVKIIYWTHSQVLLWGHWYPCFGFLATSPLCFNSQSGFCHASR